MSMRNALPLALVALFAAPMTAQDHPRGGPGMGPHHPGEGPMMMRGLDLTEAQKAGLKAIADKHREASKGRHEAAMAAMKALHEAMMDPAIPVERLKALHDKASQAQFELALDRRAMMQESLALLTPEQKAKGEKLRAEWLKKGPEAWGERGEGRRHGMPPEGPAPEKKPEGPVPEKK